MKDDAACTELIPDHLCDNERRHSMYRVNRRPQLRQWKMTQHVRSQPQTIITTMKDDAACTESTPRHDCDNERRHRMYRVNPKTPLRQWKRQSMYRVNPRPPLRHWKTTHHIQSGSQTTITTMKDDTACTESSADHYNDDETRRNTYRVNPRPPSRQGNTTQHVQSQPETTITTMKDVAACTESTPDHHYDNERRRSMSRFNPYHLCDNERRHSMYRVNRRPPLRQWKTTQHVQSQPHNTIATMKDDTACTESTPKHHYDNENDTACTESTPDPHCDIERRHTIYRVDPRPPLRQWKTTQHVQSQAQTTITMMKDDAARTESIPDHHYDSEIRHSMNIVNPRPPLRQWKTSQHVQSQLQTTITTMKEDAACADSTHTTIKTMKDDAACTESTPKHDYDNERRRSMYRVNHRPPLRQWKTTQHVQTQSHYTITTMKDDDAACTESTPKHNYDNERRHSIYRVNPKTQLRQWKTTQHLQSQLQNTITTMKDDAACTESTSKHHYDNERRRIMFRVNPRPPFRHWKTTHNVQGQPQNTITTMKDDAACT